MGSGAEARRVVQRSGEYHFPPLARNIMTSNGSEGSWRITTSERVSLQYNNLSSSLFGRHTSNPNTQGARLSPRNGGPRKTSFDC